MRAERVAFHRQSMDAAQRWRGCCRPICEQCLAHQPAYMTCGAGAMTVHPFSRAGWPRLARRDAMLDHCARSAPWRDPVFSKRLKEPGK
jgi:hypothetical protein